MARPGSSDTRRASQSVAAAALSVSALALYLFTACPEPGWIDSGLLAACSHLLDIPHPTAKQLYVLISRVFLIALPGPFWPLTFFSALAAAGAVWLAASLPFGPRRAGALAGAVAAGMVLATAPLVWQQATINEVHALQLLLFAAFLWFWFHTHVRGRTAMLFYLAALAFANHGTAIFLAPFLLEALWRERKRRAAWLAAAAFALLGLGLYLYFPLRSSAGALLDWDAPSSWGGFWRHFTGWQFAVWLGAGSAADFFERLRQFGWHLWDNLPWIMLPLSGYGFYVLFRRRNWMALTMLSSFLLCVVVSCSYGIPDIEPYFLVAILLAVVWLGFGLADLFGRRLRLGVVVALAAAASLAPSLPSRFERCDASRFHVATDWIRDAAQTVEPGGVVLTRFWDHYSPWFYLRHVEDFRTDMLWLDIRLIARSWYPAYLRRVAPARCAAAEAELDRLAPLVARFEAGEPVDSVALQRAYADAVYALSLGQPGPVYVDALAPPGSDWGDPVRYVRDARLAACGLLLRALRPGEPEQPVTAWPHYRNWAVTGSVSERTAYHLDLYDLAYEAWRAANQAQ